MKLRKWLENWDLKKLSISAGFLDMDWEPQTADQDAAWELYVEMLTRVVTQPLEDNAGDEKTALNSVYKLFDITREILRRRGRDCVQFSKIAVIVLNQILRPFTAKWHKRLLSGDLDRPEVQVEFRLELEVLQLQLREYTKTLARIADVEDISDLAF